MLSSAIVHVVIVETVETVEIVDAVKVADAVKPVDVAGNAKRVAVMGFGRLWTRGLQSCSVSHTAKRIALHEVRVSIGSIFLPLANPPSILTTFQNYLN